MPLCFDFEVTFTVVPAAAGSPSVDPAAMLAVLLLPPYVRIEEDDDDWFAYQTSETNRTNIFLTTLVQDGHRATTGFGVWNSGSIARIFEKLAKAFPAMSFTIECGDSDAGYPSRHWFSNGAHTHSQTQTLQWAEKVAIAAPAAAAE